MANVRVRNFSLGCIVFPVLLTPKLNITHLNVQKSSYDVNPLAVDTLKERLPHAAHAGVQFPTHWSAPLTMEVDKLTTVHVCEPLWGALRAADTNEEGSGLQVTLVGVDDYRLTALNSQSSQ